MARRYNELYLGNEFLNIQGREIKHVGLMREFGNANVNKVSDDPLKLVTMDLETNHLTAELKLLGTWDGKTYIPHDYRNSNFLATLFNLVDKVFWTKGNNALGYWNKLDPFILYKQFLLLYNEDRQKYSMTRYGKLGGEWNKLEGVWTQKPVCQVTITRGHRKFKFGIKNVIRSSVQFFYYEIIAGKCKQLNNEKYIINTLWAYDIAPLYKYNLAKEMESRVDLFPYYSKIDETAHLVDWDRYETDANYRDNIVLLSNKYDAMAVYDLGTLLINDFKKAFHYYPRQLISSGAIARASIVATLRWKYSNIYTELKDVDKAIKNDLQAIGLINFYDVWHLQMQDDTALKDMFCLFYEAYSGGMIEAIRYGLIKSGYYSDLASAYIKHIIDLMDLRDSKVTHGVGDPPHIENSYCFLRGTIDIPLHVNYHPITVKHVTNKETNVRAVGTYKGSYTINERDFLIELGSTFYDEVWYNIETKGIQSPLGLVTENLTNLRYKAIERGDSSEYVLKTAAASIYGITYEATNTFVETDQLEVIRNGYRGGEFLNPLFATWITAETRLQMSRASNNIDDNGGKPVILMTDCVFWEGEANALDKKFIRDKKTLGYFETPVAFSEMACLGTGRYSFTDSKKGYVTTKNRGLNVFDFHRPEGIDIGVYNWINALKLAEETNSLKIKVKVRLLISVGMILHSINDKYDDKGSLIKKAYSVHDLGKVVQEDREVDLVTGLTKRLLSSPINNVKDITRGSISTESIYYGIGMQGDGKLIDQTLPILREEVQKLDVKTARKRDLANRSKASLKYNETHKVDILSVERAKYKMLKDFGYSRDVSKLWCKRSYERIHEELLNNEFNKKNPH